MKFRFCLYFVACVKGQQNKCIFKEFNSKIVSIFLNIFSFRPTQTFWIL